MATRRKIRRQYGERHVDLSESFAAAYLDLRLRNVPPAVNAIVERTADFLAKVGEQRTPELIAEWKEIHAALMAARDELAALVTDRDTTG